MKLYKGASLGAQSHFIADGMGTVSNLLHRDLEISISLRSFTRNLDFLDLSKEPAF